MERSHWLKRSVDVDLRGKRWTKKRHKSGITAKEQGCKSSPPLLPTSAHLRETIAEDRAVLLAPCSTAPQYRRAHSWDSARNDISIIDTFTRHSQDIDAIRWVEVVRARWLHLRFSAEPGSSLAEFTLLFKCRGRASERKGWGDSHAPCRSIVESLSNAIDKNHCEDRDLSIWFIR